MPETNIVNLWRNHEHIRNRYGVEGICTSTRRKRHFPDSLVRDRAHPKVEVVNPVTLLRDIERAIATLLNDITADNLEIRDLVVLLGEGD